MTNLGINTNQQGVTLIELLIVMTLIGLLATFVVGNLGEERDKARATDDIATVQQIVLGLEQFEGVCGGYPESIDRSENKYGISGEICDGHEFGDFISSSFDLTEVSYYPFQLSDSSSTVCRAFHIGVMLDVDSDTLVEQESNVNSDDIENDNDWTGCSLAGDSIEGTDPMVYDITRPARLID